MSFGQEAASPELAAHRLGRLTFALTFVLACVVAGLGLARLASGPWYQVYAPLGGRLLEGWPTSWEAIYYLVHFPTFLGDAPPWLGISAVQQRTLLHLYLASALYAWTGSAFWSLAAVDLMFWFLAGIAGYHVALRLGAAPWAAALNALMTVASPILVSNMWRHDLHVANFATMPLGLWAAMVLVDEHHSRRRLAATLGLLLLLLSLTYQYQWILIPLFVVLLTASPRVTPRQALAVALGATLLYLIATAALGAALAMVGLGASVGELKAVSQPGELLAARLASLRSPADVLAALPGRYRIEVMVQAYHPAVFVAGLAGLALLPRRTRWLALVASAVALLASTLYGPPWTAMSAYPFIYAGAGVSCAAAGTLAARAVAAVPWLSQRPARWSVGLARAVSLSLTLLLAALTNLDLVGDQQFLLLWWNYYSGRTLF